MKFNPPTINPKATPETDVDQERGGTIPGRVILAWIAAHQPAIVEEYAIVDAALVCANCGDGTGNGHYCEEPQLVEVPTQDEIERWDDELQEEER